MSQANGSSVANPVISKAARKCAALAEAKAAADKAAVDKAAADAKAAAATVATSPTVNPPSAATAAAVVLTAAVVTKLTQEQFDSHQETAAAEVAEWFSKADSAALRFGLRIGKAAWAFVNWHLLRSGGNSLKIRAAAVAAVIVRMTPKLPAGLAAPDSSSIGRCLGYAALARLFGEEKLLSLPVSYAKQLVTLLHADQTAPGLEYIDLKGKPQIGYSFGNGEADWSADATAIMAEITSGKILSAEALTVRMKEVRIPTKGRGKKGDAKAAEATAAADSAKAAAVAADKAAGISPEARLAATRLETGLRGTKKAPLDSAAVMRAAVGAGTVKVDDILAAVGAIATGAGFSTSERMAALKLIRGTANDAVNRLKLQLLAAEATAAAAVKIPA